MSIPFTPNADVIAALKAGEDILCVSHIAPDGDAVGSLLGMGWILRALGKSPTLTLQDAVPVEHRVLPGAKDVITSNTASYETSVRQHKFDLVICLDASSQDRMGDAYNNSVHESAELVVIDHHITNTHFGDVNWVEPQCAATCQMLVYLADMLEVALTGALAECLLTGIVTDTLAFRTSNTTPEVLEAATQCMEGGISLNKITQRTLNRRPFSILKIWSQALAHMQLQDGIIWAPVTLDELHEHGAENLDLNLSSFLVTADEADISAVFIEKAENGAMAVECSFRAKPGFDVASVAFSLGGGGHPAASGCTITGTLDEVIADVVPMLQKARGRSDARRSLNSSAQVHQPISWAARRR